MTEKKAAASTPSAAETLAQTADFMGLMGVGWKRFEQLDAISKSIFQRIQEERQAEVQLGLAILQCPTPADAFILYTKWLSQRTTALLEEGPKLAELWTQLYAPPLAKTSAPLPED